VDLRRLDLLEAFFPQVDSVTGGLQADLRIAGTAADPRLAGNARTSGAGAYLPDLGIRLHDIVVDAKTEGGHLAFEASAASGPGRVRMTGDADLAAGATPRVSAHVVGERFLAAALEEDQRVLVSPDLRLTLVGDSLRAEGQVTIPEAVVELEDLRARATVPVSADVVYAHPEDRLHRPAIRAFARVGMTLGDDVRIRGSGLNGRATGSLVVLDSPDLPVRASGQIELLDGTYQAYGENLTIERGRLFYGGGSIMNPGVDLRVSRKAPDGTVAGLQVSGTLRKTQLTVWSEPQMSERAALSYVLFGRPMEDTDQEQATELADAADQLGLQAGNWLTGTVAHEVGIANASIETKGPLEEATLALGTYLSPRLHVRYGLGLFESSRKLDLNYILSSRWTLQAEVGDANRASVLYEIER
jgi:translocation and assembly module TamB